MSINAYQICPGKDRRAVDLISDALPFGRLWYAERDAVANAIGYAKFTVDQMKPATARVAKDSGDLPLARCSTLSTVSTSITASPHAVTCPQSLQKKLQPRILDLSRKKASLNA